MVFNASQPCTTCLELVWNLDGGEQGIGGGGAQSDQQLAPVVPLLQLEQGRVLQSCLPGTDRGLLRKGWQRSRGHELEDYEWLGGGRGD